MSVLTFDDMHLIEDNLETVTFRSLTSEVNEEYTDTTVTQAYGVAATRLEENDAATGDKVWHIRASSISGTTPKERDQVQDSAGRRWVVDRIEIMDHGTRYRLTCSLGRKADGTMG